MASSLDTINEYADLESTKTHNERPNPKLKEFAYLQRFTENGMALEGKGGIILKNGKYQVHKFVHRLDPIYASVPVTWIKKNVDNNQPIGLLQINNNAWDGSVPIIHATRSNVRFYGCCLDPEENDADVEELNAKDGGMFDFNYTSFYDHWTKERNDQKGTGGCRIERHEFAHIETPLSREGKSGVFILGKLVDNDQTLLLTAFIIARGQTLFVPPNVIHTNDYQRGLWRTYLEIGDVDICDLVKRTGFDHKIERTRLNFYCGLTKKRLKQYDIEPLEIQCDKSEEHEDEPTTKRQHTLLRHLNDNDNCEHDRKENEDTEQLHEPSPQSHDNCDKKDDTEALVPPSPRAHPQSYDTSEPMIPIHSKPNLFRPDTTTPWDTSDIKDLEDEMAQELENLILSHTQNSIKSDDSGHENSSDTMLTLMDRGSNLIQAITHDWDSEDMELEEHQMMKHLTHLRNESGDANQF